MLRPKIFKETVGLQRFELQSLHSAHPLLIGSPLDPCFKSITLSKFNESEIKALKNGLIELMEVAVEQATEESSQDIRDTTALGTLTSTLCTGDSVTPPAKKERLIVPCMLLGLEQLSQDSTLENELKNY